MGLFESTLCPICDADDVEVLRAARHPPGTTEAALLEVYRSSSDVPLLDRLVRCRRCSLVYVSPRVKAEVVHRAYADAEDPAFLAQNALRVRTFRRSWRRITRRHPRLAPGTRVLDVGCAAGAFLEAAQSLGYPGVGIEPSAWLCQQGREAYGLDLRPGFLADHFPAAREEGDEPVEGSFGAATLWDVLEHLTDPGRDLERLHGLLAPGGFLVVNFPDYGSLARRLLRERWPFWLNVHLLYFTPATVRKLLERCGFQVLDTFPYWQTLELGYVLQRAAPYVPGADRARRAIERVGLGRVPCTYQVGQTCVVATPR